MFLNPFCQSTWSPLTLGRKREWHLLIAGWDGSLGSPCGLLWYFGRETSATPSWDESPRSPLNLLDTTPGGECYGCLVTARQERKSKLPIQHLGVVTGLWFFLWCLAGIEQLCLKVFYLASWPISSSFGQRAFLGTFLFVPIGVSRLTASPASTLRYMSKKEDPGNSLPCYSWGPRVPSWSVFLFLPSAFLCLFYT